MSLLRKLLICSISFVSSKQKMPIATLSIVENSAIVELDFWEIHTADVSHRQDQFVNRTHAHQMANV